MKGVAASIDGVVGRAANGQTFEFVGSHQVRPTPHLATEHMCRCGVGGGLVPVGK